MVLCRHCGTANETGRRVCIKCQRELIAEHMRGKIACVNHANREATTSCNSCGVRLCDTCAYLLNGIEFCEGCAPEGAVEREHHADYEAQPVVDGGHTDHASLGARAYAAIVDLGLLAAFASVLAFGLAMLNGGGVYAVGYAFLRKTSHPAFWVFWALVPVASIAYHTLLIGMDGRTLGKRLAGVIVLQEDGRIADMGEALWRALGQALSLLPLGLGYLWALWDPKHETWHDKLSKTVAFRYQDTT